MLRFTTAQVQTTSMTFPATPTLQSTPFIYVGIYGADNQTKPSTGYYLGPIGE